MFCASCGKKIITPGKFCEFCGGETGMDLTKGESLAVTTAESSKDKTNKVAEVKVKKLTKKQKQYGIIIGILLVLVFSGFKFSEYKNNPEQVINQYANAMNSGNYDKVSQYYEDFMKTESFTKAMIVKSLEDMAENEKQPKIRVVEKGPRRDQMLKSYGYEEFELLDKNRFIVPVELDYGNNNKDTGVVELYKSVETNKWQVPYQYRLNNLSIEAPIGTTILVDDVEIEGIESSNIQHGPLLPGKHKVEMRFFNDIQEPYITEVYMPDESHLVSPYDVHKILIKTVRDSEIIFDGVSLDTEDGYVYINDVLEGEHSLVININDSIAKSLETSVMVEQGSKEFYFYEFEAQDSFDKIIKQTITNYNDALHKAYENYNEDEDEYEQLQQIQDFATEYMIDNEFYDFRSFHQRARIKSQTSKLDIYQLRVGAGENIFIDTIEDWNTKEELVESYYWNYSINDGREIELKNKVESTYEIVNENGTWKVAHVERNYFENTYLNDEGQWEEY